MHHSNANQTPQAFNQSQHSQACLYCVSCGGECLHPEAVYVLGDDDMGNYNVRALAAPSRGLAALMFPSSEIVALIRGGNRGTEIARLFTCEFCSDWSVFVDGFHKGTTYTRSLALRFSA